MSEVQFAVLSGRQFTRFNEKQPASKLAEQSTLLATGMQDIGLDSFVDLSFIVAHTPDKEIVGIRSYYPYADGAGKELYLCDILQVLPEYQGRGLGRELMQRFIDEAKEKSARIDGICLSSEQGLHMAPLLERSGIPYTISGTLKDSLGLS